MIVETVTEQASNGKSRDKDGLHKRRGIWHFRLKVAGRWKEISTRTKNYRQAREIRHQTVQAQEAGRLPTDMAKWPFEKAAAEWLSGRGKLVQAEALAENTHRIDKERLKPLLNAFSGKRLCEITGDDLVGYRMARTSQVSSRTINLEVKVLRMVLKQARLWSRIADDYKPLPEKKRGPGRALTDEQEQRLFSLASSNPNWQAAFLGALFAANVGTRNIEVRTLQIKDIHLAEELFYVRRDATKSDAGCRAIPLNDQAKWAAARLLERAAGLGSHLPEHYLFPAYRFRRTKGAGPVAGTGYDPNAPMKGWRTAWRALTRKAGLPGLRFHDLRHNFVTKHLEAGTPEHTLMAMVGHVSREMLEHYSHVRMKAKQEAVQRVHVNVSLPEEVAPKLVH